MIATWSGEGKTKPFNLDMEAHAARALRRNPELTEQLHSIRKSAEGVYEHTLDQKPAVLEAFADVPEDCWRVMVAAIRYPTNDYRVLEAMP